MGWWLGSALVGGLVDKLSRSAPSREPSECSYDQWKNLRTDQLFLEERSGESRGGRYGGRYAQSDAYAMHQGSGDLDLRLRSHVYAMDERADMSLSARNAPEVRRSLLDRPDMDMSLREHAQEALERIGMRRGSALLEATLERVGSSEEAQRALANERVDVAMAGRLGAEDTRSLVDRHRRLNEAWRGGEDGRGAAAAERRAEIEERLAALEARREQLDLDGVRLCAGGRREREALEDSRGWRGTDAGGGIVGYVGGVPGRGQTSLAAQARAAHEQEAGAGAPSRVAARPVSDDGRGR